MIQIIESSYLIYKSSSKILQRLCMWVMSVRRSVSCEYNQRFNCCLLTELSKLLLQLKLREAAEYNLMMSHKQKMHYCTSHFSHSNKHCTSLAAVRYNLALESIVGFWWMMFVKVTNIKDKLTGHLSALSNFRYGRYSI